MRLQLDRGAGGDTIAPRAVLGSGSVIGTVEQRGPGVFVVRGPQGHLVCHWLSTGDTPMTFSALTDAAAAVWLGFMARSPNTGHLRPPDDPGAPDDERSVPMTNLPDLRHREGDTHATDSDPDSPCVRFPVAWAETGQFGVLVVSPQAWRGLAYSYQAAGAPEGEPSRFQWWYRWDGRCFVPYARIEPRKPHHPTVWGSLAWSA
jgi:hypothetical protein